ncbi:galactose-3-O-sulfotransferase 3-like [Planococcus citri]|uniref:galactose-3-O-sulfotransferase 3-like n=1 Tax=Planococcus citri TaxID=170843 RepID=UPI0031F819D5
MWHKLLLKRKIIISASLSLLLIASLWYLGKNFQKFNKQTTPTITLPTISIEKSEEPPAYECCTQSKSTFRKNIYFLKTHKTGSSTIQSIILRFALRHSLNVMNPILYLYNYPISKDTIDASSSTPDNKYNILAHHVRYSSNLASFQYPNTVTVTVLRNPVTLFPSLYNYFNMAQINGMTLQQFLRSPAKPSTLWGIGSPWIYRGYNQMSYDLGFDLQKDADNQTAVDEFVAKIDREFDFVMIMEYMEESLVLLARLMGWPLQSMMHLKLNARPADPNAHVLTADEKITILKLNHVDAALYYHFEKKFRKCVDQYGKEKLQGEIVELRQLNEKFYRRCVDREVQGGDLGGILGAISYVPKNNSDLECVYATQLSLTLEQTIRDIQSTRLNLEKRLPKFR